MYIRSSRREENRAKYILEKMIQNFLNLMKDTDLQIQLA